MDKYMLLAVKEAKKAFKNGDVPVGSVIVKNGEVISKDYNKKEKKNVATNHAEVLAINKACQKLNTWHLDDCVLYTTMEPCMMCCGAIVQSRIKKVFYCLKNEKYGASKIIKNVEFIDIYDNYDYENLLKNFFEQIR